MFEGATALQIYMTCVCTMHVWCMVKINEHLVVVHDASFLNQRFVFSFMHILNFKDHLLYSAVDFEHIAVCLVEARMSRFPISSK